MSSSRAPRGRSCSSGPSSDAIAPPRGGTGHRAPTSARSPRRSTRPTTRGSSPARMTPRSSRRCFGCARPKGSGWSCPTRDEELPVLAGAREPFAAAGTVVLVSPPDAVETCRDKARFVAAVRAAGLRHAAPSTRTRPPRAIRRSSSHAGARAVGAPRGSRPRWSCAAVRRAPGRRRHDPGARRRPGVHGRRLPRPRRPADLVRPARARRRSWPVSRSSARTVATWNCPRPPSACAAAIGLSGTSRSRHSGAPTGVAFIEVNPRYGGAANLGFAAGAPTPGVRASALARGERLEPRLDDVRGRADDAPPRGGPLRPRRRSRRTGGDPRDARARAVLFDLDDTLYPERQFVDGGFRAVAGFLAARSSSAGRRSTVRLLGAPRPRRPRPPVRHPARRARRRPTIPTSSSPASSSTGPTRRASTPFHGRRAAARRPAAGRGPNRVSSPTGTPRSSARKLAALAAVAARLEPVVMTDELGPGRREAIADRRSGSPAGSWTSTRRLPSTSPTIRARTSPGARAAGPRARSAIGHVPDEGGADRPSFHAGATTPTSPSTRFAALSARRFGGDAMTAAVLHRRPPDRSRPPRLRHRRAVGQPRASTRTPRPRSSTPRPRPAPTPSSSRPTRPTRSRSPATRPPFRAGSGSLWEGTTLHDLYQEAYMPWEWQPRSQGARRVARHGLLLLAVRPDRGRLPRAAMDVPGLQGRLVRARRPAADPPHGRDRQAADHLDRHGDRSRDRRGRRGRSRRRSDRARAAQVHERLPVAARGGQPPGDPGDGRALGRADRPLRPHPAARSCRWPRSRSVRASSRST